jgi:hypothetical protein
VKNLLFTLFVVSTSAMAWDGQFAGSISYIDVTGGGEL